jgi:hypothetical protein
MDYLHLGNTIFYSVYMNDGIKVIKHYRFGIFINGFIEQVSYPPPLIQNLYRIELVCRWKVKMKKFAPL